MRANSTIANLFGSEAMAAGYASSRPPLHRRVIEKAYGGLGPVRRVLDVGCGAGLSTRALAGLAPFCIGLEPAEPMLRWTASVAPQARFVVGRAEALPFEPASFDLLTAAGSLNYVADLDSFFTDASRVIASAGRLLIYDFQPGRSFRNSDALDDWFELFSAKYPWPASEARPLNPQLLADITQEFEIRGHEDFEIGLELTPEFYLNYMLTESNVAFALRRGIAFDEIRDWCAASLEPVWRAHRHEVMFSGYWAALKSVSRHREKS